jgi:hypothetical protein
MTTLSPRAQLSLACGALPRAGLLCAQLTWRVAPEDAQSTFRDVVEFRIVTFFLIPLFFFEKIRRAHATTLDCAPHLHRWSIIPLGTRP